MFVADQVQKSIPIHIENVVATATINKTINISRVVKNIPNIQYDRKRFPGGIARMQSPKVVVLFFSTGKVVCTGGTSTDMTKNALEKFARILESVIGKVVLSEIKIENIVSSANFQKKVHLEQAAKTLPRSLYEPEQFPGIIHRPHYPKTVILVFASGKLVCTGGKTVEELHNSIHAFYSLLKEKKLLIED